MKPLSNKSPSQKGTVIDDYVNADGIWFMVNLHQVNTGLPMIIWISPKMDNYDPGIKVQNNYLNKITGYLLYDYKYENVIGKYRATAWEVHPINSIEVLAN